MVSNLAQGGIPSLDNLLKVQDITLVTDLTINANSNIAIQYSDIPQLEGYTPILVVPQNSWNLHINFWYCQLMSSTKVHWRVGNVSNNNISGITIRATVLYLKNLPSTD